MLHIDDTHPGRLRLTGRFDAAQVPKASPIFRALDSSCVVDMEGLTYISSAGLGVLLETQKRLSNDAHTLRLTNVDPHVLNVFVYAGFDRIFEIE